MSRAKLVFLSFTFMLFSVWGCASYKTQYQQPTLQLEASDSDENLEIDHSFYLIGDAGNAEFNKGLNHFQLLKEELLH